MASPSGSLRNVPPTVTATVLFNTVGWGYVHLRASHHWSAEQARAGVVDLALRGLLTTSQSGSNPGGSAAVTARRGGRSVAVAATTSRTQRKWRSTQSAPACAACCQSAPGPRRKLGA